MGSALARGISSRSAQARRGPHAACSMENKHHDKAAISSPDGRFRAEASESNTVTIVDARAGKPWGTYYGHQEGLYRRLSGTIKVLVWLPDGNSIVSGSTDGSIHVWHARTGIHQRTLTEAQEGCEVAELILSRAGTLTALRGKEARTWQLCS